MTELPAKLSPYRERISCILGWIGDGCHQDDFDRQAAATDWNSLDGMHYYHGDTPIIGVFYQGQEWLELLSVLLGEKLVSQAANGDGTFTYAKRKNTRE
jgi:hypothetical protein